MCRFWGIISEVKTSTAPLKGERMKRILMVDDDEDLRIRCLNELSKEGYHVYPVSSGLEALKFIDQEPSVDLIILDLKMTPMDGIEVLEELRRKNVTVPVIIYSGHAGYKNNFETWLADAFVVKQSDLSELKDKIKELLSSKETDLIV